MNESDRWLPALMVIYVLVLTALLFYFAASSSVRNLRYEIGDLRRDIGEVQRELEFQREQDDRDVERILYELRRIR